MINLYHTSITTNLKLEELHAQAKQAHRDALFRRITKIEDMWQEPERNEVVSGNTRPRPVQLWVDKKWDEYVKSKWDNYR